MTNDITTAHTPSFDYKAEALALRAKFGNSHDKLKKAKKTAQKESRSNVADLHDFKLAILSDPTALAAICNELGKMGLIKETKEKSLKDVFLENIDLCIIKYVFRIKMAKKDNQDDDDDQIDIASAYHWDYNRSHNIHALVLNQLSKHNVAAGDALDFIESFKLATDDDGKTGKKGIQALVEKERQERGVGSKREQQHAETCKAVSKYLDKKGHFAEIDAATLSITNVEEGAFHEYIPVLARITSDGRLIADRLLPEEVDFTRKQVLRLKKDADTWAADEASKQSKEAKATSGSSSDTATEAVDSVSAKDFEEFSQSAA